VLRNVIGLFVFSIALAVSVGHVTPAQAQSRLVQAPAQAPAKGQTPAVPVQTPKELTLGSFKSASLWPIWAAQHQGMFQGLDLKKVYPADSAAQMIGLIQGRFDVVITALDDVIAYAEGEGGPRPRRNADLIAFLGVDNGGLSLIARPEIQGLVELKNRTLAVDAIGSALSFVLREIFAREFFTTNYYKVVALGNASARWEALRENKVAATLLMPPFSDVALAQGYNLIGNIAAMLRGYQGGVAAARRDWAVANADSVTSFIRGYRAGLDWLKAPANRAAALDILRREMPETTPATAEEDYGSLIVNPQGFNPGGRIDAAGARRVFELRRRYGPQGKPAPDIGGFIDDSYFQRAIRP
jgi:ABC-type nitrate/sulfonate/bicarbonate transport system substrate-binding protein